ncbi:MAG: hypothetical protein R2752_19605 [Vicinamibacterales bacterium]
MPSLVRAAALVGLAALAAGCHKVQARTVEPLPAPPAPLTAPEPPGRLIIPQPLPAEPPAEAAPQPAPPQRQPARPASSTTPPATASTTTPPPTEPPPVVQTSQNATQLEQQARKQLSQANSDMAAVDYGALSSSGKTTYEEVRRLMRQVDDLLRIKNYVLAADLANKAALLASQLKKHEAAPGLSPISS